MAYCVVSREYAVGWADGGNRRRFEAMAESSAIPMGIVASIDGEPVGWCACGPRSRYDVATSPRSTMMRGRDRGEDDSVWLLPCLFVRVGHRGKGITYALVDAAVELGRRHGAVAIEGWPRGGAVRGAPDAHLGREKLFTESGFRSVRRPSPQRVIMRLDL